MFEPEIAEWLTSNITPRYFEHVKSSQAEVRQDLRRLEIAETTEFAEFYLRFGAYSVRGWYELNEMHKVWDWTQFVRKEFGVPSNYVALTSIEGQGVTLYNRDTEQVFDVELGHFDKLTDGTLLPVATTFSDFLKWCMSKDHG